MGMEMTERMHRLFDKAMQAHVESERQWWHNSRHGRWVVLEPGPGRLLTDAPQHVRQYIDAITPQRGRRFSSLSRARAFARQIGGEVRRWRRYMFRRVGARSVKTTWHYETNPWKRVADRLPLMLWGAHL